MLVPPRHGALVVQGVAWAGWLVWPLLAWLGWRLARRWRQATGAARLRGAAALLALAWFVEMRFVEPQWITTRHTALDLGFRARIALVADVHLGPYKSAQFLDRVVDRLNAMELDAVLIAGDHLYHPHRPLDELLAPLRRLRHPAFSVPGNHDEPPLERQVTPEALRQALAAAGVRPVEYGHARLAGFTLVGLGDRFAGKDGLAPLQAAPTDRPLVVMAHNPDSAMQLAPGSAALVVSGHTHGGQIRIPGLYRLVIPCEHPFDRGLHGFGPVPVFVTSGLGEVGLPLRFLNPPVIDVLEIR
jgi:hypothetical protein